MEIAKKQQRELVPGGKRVHFICGPREVEILERIAAKESECVSVVMRRAIRSLEQREKSA